MLPEPLLTFNLYQTFIDTHGIFLFLFFILLFFFFVYFVLSSPFSFFLTFSPLSSLLAIYTDKGVEPWIKEVTSLLISLPEPNQNALQILFLLLHKLQARRLLFLLLLLLLLLLLALSLLLLSLSLLL